MWSLAPVGEMQRSVGLRVWLSGSSCRCAGDKPDQERRYNGQEAVDEHDGDYLSVVSAEADEKRRSVMTWAELFEVRANLRDGPAERPFSVRLCKRQSG
jgi:hypothetical protein